MFLSITKKAFIAAAIFFTSSAFAGPIKILVYGSGGIYTNGDDTHKVCPIKDPGRVCAEIELDMDYGESNMENYSGVLTFENQKFTVQILNGHVVKKEEEQWYAEGEALNIKVLKR